MLGTDSYSPGKSLLERLPNELLLKILELLIPQHPATSSVSSEWFMSEQLPCKDVLSSFRGYFVVLTVDSFNQ